MIYKVSARFREGSAAEFLLKLQDGSIASQQPDGAEMVDSMNRAVVTESGEVEWSETCYCSPPLAHERRTVLDHYFSDLSTEAIGSYQDYAGLPFLDYLEELANTAP